MYGLRGCESKPLELIELVVQGSIPWVSVGFMALFFVMTIVTRYISLRKVAGQEEGSSMENKTRSLLCGLVAETLWAVEASSIAAALPA